MKSEREVVIAEMRAQAAKANGATVNDNYEAARLVKWADRLSASVPGEAVAEPRGWLVQWDWGAQRACSFFTRTPGSEVGKENCVAITPLYTHPAVSASVVTEEMVSRFLGWKVPQDFAPDGGVSFTPIDYPEHPQMREQCWPIGTNLLTATQARAMLEHVLDGLPAPRTYADALAIANDPKLRAKP